MKCRNCRTQDTISPTNPIDIKVGDKEKQTITESVLCPQCYIIFSAFNSGKVVTGNISQELSETYVQSPAKKSFFQKIGDWFNGRD